MNFNLYYVDLEEVAISEVEIEINGQFGDFHSKSRREKVLLF
ncbi:hypothetical protein [Methanosarcina horonobensis]|nr:hypothetical protein [Methanosarcina horonobensis]